MARANGMRYAEVGYMNKSRSDFPLGRYLDTAEKTFILKHLRQSKGNVTHAAKACGLTYRQLRRLILKHGIVRSDYTVTLMA